MCGCARLCNVWLIGRSIGLVDIDSNNGGTDDHRFCRKMNDVATVFRRLENQTRSGLIGGWLPVWCCRPSNGGRLEEGKNSVFRQCDWRCVGGCVYVDDNGDNRLPSSIVAVDNNQDDDDDDDDDDTRTTWSGGACLMAWVVCRPFASH